MILYLMKMNIVPFLFVSMINVTPCFYYVFENNFTSKKGFVEGAQESILIN